MNYSKLADIHERLRLGADRFHQLSRLETKEEALYCYDFFFPTHAMVSKSNAITKLATDTGLFYDVIADMLPEEETWMALASESSDVKGSYNVTAEYALHFPYKATSFIGIAHRHTEIEARLLWRWLTKSKPVISKRTFFGVLAHLKSVPPHIVKQNMIRDTIIKLYDSPESIVTLASWWEHRDMRPAPMRWKPWLKLHPPDGDTYGVIIPKGLNVFRWKDNACLRNGNMLQVRKNAPLLNDSYESVFIEVDAFEQEEIIVDAVSYDEPHAMFKDRLELINTECIDLTEHGSWEKMIQKLSDDTVECVRIISHDRVYIPDSIGGYVMYPHRRTVYLRLNDIQNDTWGLGALDGLDEYVEVCRIQPLDNNIKSVDEESCIVVEVIAVRVNSRGEIVEVVSSKVRNDLGIGDIIQLTDLIERGMDDEQA